MNQVFYEITLVLVLATTLGMVARALKQPTILGYIATGLIVGPLGLMHLNNLDSIDALAQFGIAFLLFLVGLEIDLGDIKAVGKNIILVGLGQVVLTAVLGLGVAFGLGFKLLPALYIAVPLTFSSTIIVVKVLSEKRTLSSLHGKLTVGILLIQDLIALGLLILLSSFSGAGAGTGIPWAVFGFTLVKAVVALAVALAFGRWVAPPLFRSLAHSQEMLFLSSLAWGLGFAALLALPQVGLTIEIGSFFAGIALARTVEHHQIAGRVKSLRDFFLVMFFIILGSKVALTNVSAAWLPIVVFSVFVIIGNPLIVMVLMGLRGYRARTAFLTALGMGQVSEFSLVVVTLGAKLGHIGNLVVATVTAVAIVSIAVNSYLLQRGDEIYRRILPFLRLFEFHQAGAEDASAHHDMAGHVVLIGCDHMGESILQSLRQAWDDVLVVDFNPDVVKRLRKRGFRSLYGDISDPEIQEHAGLDRARLVVSTVPNLADSEHLLSHVFNTNGGAKVVVTAGYSASAKRLYKRGADYVLIPQLIGARHLAEIIGKDSKLELLKPLREHDLELFSHSAI